MEGQARQRGRRPAAVEVVAARLHAISVEGGLNLVLSAWRALSVPGPE